MIRVRVRVMGEADGGSVRFIVRISIHEGQGSNEAEVRVVVRVRESMRARKGTEVRFG